MARSAPAPGFHPGQHAAHRQDPQPGDSGDQVETELEQPVPLADSKSDAQSNALHIIVVMVGPRLWQGAFRPA